MATERHVAQLLLVGLLTLAMSPSVALGRAGQQAAGSSWIAQQAPVTSGGITPVLYNATAASQRVVWAAGSRGPTDVALTTEIVKTLDGGRTWFTQYRAADCCQARDIVAATPSRLWMVRAVADGSQIWQSDDGGDRWTRWLTTDKPLWSIAAGSANTAWAVGSGGATFYHLSSSFLWTPGASPTAATLWETTAGSSTVGWAVGEDGTVLKTIDAGATWRAQPSGVATTLLSVHAVSTDVVWATGQGGLIIKSTDGGQSWRVQPSGVTADLSDVVAVSPSTAWALASQEDGPSLILGTTDGGTTWARQYEAPRVAPRTVGGLVAFGPYAAWAVGGGTILATTTTTTADRSSLPFIARGPAS